MATKTRAQNRKSKPPSTPPPTKKSTTVPRSTPPSTKQITSISITTPPPLLSPATVTDPTTSTTKSSTKTTTIPKSKKPTKLSSVAPPPKTQKTTTTTKCVPKRKPTAVPTPKTKKNPVPSIPSQKFVSAQAKEKYEAIKKNKLLPGKGFLPTTVEVPAFISDIIEKQNWETFCHKPELAIILLVRELYANMMSYENSDVVVRGKVVSFSSDAINSIFGLDNFECAVYNDMVVASTLENFDKAL
ncbi:uncharacterized protein LOC133806305 [Humulus lupulus]|uniref:uncharacterized protein LOC133806305 n=1 Tax=Humulus lupulus TaxID=3486 RepID=UPI002B406DAF|nr:uncharacterized protein LOC133806305 [Humulus lupulus]